MRRLSVCSFVCLLLSLASPLHAADEIVLYSTDAGTLNGNWVRTSDSTAAGGQRLTSSDNGWSSTGNALASPADYVDFSFTAAGSTTYRLWLRLKAGSNSKYNDSVYVQLSDAVDESGNPIYRIGTTNGLTVNLQSCDGCGLNGWGWLAGAYWLNQSATVRFPSTGTHTLRIQTREDGVSIDQVILSPSTYLNSAPGQIGGDTTIIARTATSVSATPYSGTRAAVPGTILAQDFDNGGANVAYKDTSAGNNGGAYRQTDVDLQSSSEGNNNVGWIAAGEWLNYSVNVAAAGSYTAAFRVASSGQGGTFHLEIDGSPVSGAIAIPNTGDWQAWQTVSTGVTLPGGAHAARLVMDTAGPGGSVGNILWMKFTAGGGGTAVGSTPFSGSPIALPGTLSAANFDQGGEGVAYHDSSSGNSGGAYRSTDVDLESSADGGYDIGWTAAGEWLNYTVNVATGGAYTLQLRVASPNGGAMHVDFNGPSAVSNAIAVPATGDWQAWRTVTVTTTLAPGVQQMIVRFDTGGLNLGAVTISGGSTPPASGGGSVITVPAGGDLQNAINSAQPGDTILLTPGATYRGIFNLPVKSGSSYVTIRSAAPDSSLPASNVRITPAYASQLPRVQGGVAGAPAFTTSPGAHHYRLLFLDVSSTYAANQIIELGTDSAPQTTLESVPHDIIIDRCYIHGDVENGQKRGVALNSASTSIINSYISDIKSSQEDSQAIAGWNGPGPYTIENNYLEAAGENVLFGGADPAIPNLVVSDVSFRFNYVTKKVGWRGSSWTVKNLLELKNAQRFTIDSNIFENNWEAAQAGYSILFTPRNQDGTAPWTVVQQVTFTNNIVRHVSSVFSILGYDDAAASKQTNGLIIRNNVFEDISASRWGGAGLLVLTQGGRNVVFDHNTVFTDSNSVVYADVSQVTGFVFTNNIIPDNNWAVMGAGSSEGTGTLAAFYPSAVFTANVLSGSNSGLYPSGNYFPSSVNAVGFVDLSGGNYRLSESSPYKWRGTDGLDIGCNIDALPK